VPIQSFAMDIAARPNAAAMNVAQTRTVDILWDDIQWLEARVEELLGSNHARQRKLADCYLDLLRQRRQQLAVLRQGGEPCPGCWHDYLL